MSVAETPESMNVLIVEDSLAERFRMVALLKNLGYQVSQAASGEEALSMLEHQQVTIILSDWSMPGMSGVDLCRRVAAGDYGQPYFILVTGRDTTEDLVEGIEAGADDFIRKPFVREELRVRLMAGVRIMQMRQSLQAKNIELEASIERERALSSVIRQDLEAAAQMLLKLLPDNVVCKEHLEIAGLFKPAIGIGGDFYNFFRLDDDHLGFYLFDIAGHGIPSALLAFSLARILSPGSEEGAGLLMQEGLIRSPADVVARLNRQMVAESAKTQYLTMVYGVLDIATGNGQFCQAGHPHPLKLTADGQFEALGNNGFPVNLIDEADYENTDFYLAPDEALVLFSDGVTESENDQTEQYGIERLAADLTEDRSEPVADCLQRIYSRVKNWSGSQEQADDLTLMMLRHLKH